MYNGHKDDRFKGYVRGIIESPFPEVKCKFDDETMDIFIENTKIHSMSLETLHAGFDKSVMYFIKVVKEVESKIKEYRLAQSTELLKSMSTSTK